MPAISFLPFLQTIPFATRILTLTLIATTLGSLLLAVLTRGENDDGVIGGGMSSMRHAIPWGVHSSWLVMIPGDSWKFPWVLLTSGFVELSIVELVISAISLPLAARYLERIWGPRELVRFCLVTIIGSNIIAFGFSWLTYFILRDENYSLYGIPYHGLSGLQVGFLVAFTQLAPEHQLQLLGRFKVRVKTLPGIYILISNVLVILLGPSPYILIQFGFFVAWVYLRFYKLSEDGLSRGDKSETFAFQYWFPPPIRPYVSKLANLVFRYANRFKLIQGWDDSTVGGSTGAYAMLPGPGQARAEAERRRALALKALDARLASGPTSSGGAAVGTSPSSATAPPGGGASNAGVGAGVPQPGGPAEGSSGKSKDEGKVKVKD